MRWDSGAVDMPNRVSAGARALKGLYADQVLDLICEWVEHHRAGGLTMPPPRPSQLGRLRTGEELLNPDIQGVGDPRHCPECQVLTALDPLVVLGGSSKPLSHVRLSKPLRATNLRDPRRNALNKLLGIHRHLATMRSTCSRPTPSCMMVPFREGNLGGLDA